MATALCIIPPFNVFKIGKGVICLDIGANIGSVTESLLENGAIKVHCIEAGKNNCKTLRQKFENNEKIVIYETGVSDEKKILKNVTWLNSWLIGNPQEINLPVSPGACDIEGYDLVDINLDTVDDLFENNTENINFFKIDVDGYDFKVIKGARKLIDRCRPIIYIELSCYYDIVEKNSVEKFVNYVEEMGYSFITLDNVLQNKEYILKHFPHHSSCDVFLCPNEKILYLTEMFSKNN